MLGFRQYKRMHQEIDWPSRVEDSTLGESRLVESKKLDSKLESNPEPRLEKLDSTRQEMHNFSLIFKIIYYWFACFVCIFYLHVLSACLVCIFYLHVLSACFVNNKCIILLHYPLFIKSKHCMQMRHAITIYSMSHLHVAFACLVNDKCITFLHYSLLDWINMQMRFAACRNCLSHLRVL